MIISYATDRFVSQHIQAFFESLHHIVQTIHFAIQLLQMTQPFLILFMAVRHAIRGMAKFPKGIY